MGFGGLSSTAFMLLLCTPFLEFVNGIDVESAKETSCFQITKTADIDPTWADPSTTKVWYYSLMSRLDLYYSSIELTGRDANDLQEDEVYYDSCMQNRMLKDAIEVTGFGDKRDLLELLPENKTITGVDSVRFKWAKSGNGGISYPTFTDNATFIFAAACMDDNQMTWGVVSTVKRLPEESIKLIHEHAESLGFKKQFFTGTRFDYCKFS